MSYEFTLPDEILEEIASVRRLKSKEGLAFLSLHWPGLDWNKRASSLAHLARVEFETSCCKKVFRYLAHDERVVCKPIFCGYCNQCLHENTLRILMQLAAALKKVSKPVLLRLFDLSALAKQSFVTVRGEDVFWDTEAGWVSGEVEFKLPYGFQILGEEEKDQVNREKGILSKLIHDANKDSPEVGAMAAEIAGFPFEAFALGSPARLRAEFWRPMPMLWICSEVGSRPKKSAKPRLIPFLEEWIDGQELLERARRLLGVGRKPMYNFTAEPDRKGRAAIIGLYGSWRSKDERVPAGERMFQVKDLRNQAWPWCDLDERLKTSRFEELLSGLHKSAQVGLSPEDGYSLRKLAGWWRGYYRLREAAFLLRRRAKARGAQASDAGSLGQRDKYMEDFFDDIDEAATLDAKSEELRQTLIHQLESQLAKSRPGVSGWRDILEPVLASGEK